MAWHMPRFQLARAAVRERGQVLIMAALLMPMLLGMTAIAIDVGRVAAERRSLQNAADAAALAAVQDLPNQTAARTSALEWAANHGVDSGNVSVSFSYAGNEDDDHDGDDDHATTVTVVIDNQIEFVFARILGVNNTQVAARASATKASFGGGGQIVPWGVLESVIDGSSNGALVTMKYDAQNPLNGNFGAVRIDGSDSTYYEDAIKYGSDSTVCSESTAGCAPADCPGASCVETAPECDGYECRPKTGNMTGPTRNGVDYRMNNTTAACDTFAETFQQDASGNYRLDPDCNPWLDGGSGSLRVIIIPVVEAFGNGSSDPLKVESFALMYLEGYEAGACTGNSCEINGRFITNAITVPGLVGEYDNDSSLVFWRLSE